MKKCMVLLISMMLVFCLVACSSSDGGNNTDRQQNSTDSTRAQSSETTNESLQTEGSTELVVMTQSSDTEKAEGHQSSVLIAYFSIPEDVDTSGTDAIAGASIVVREGEVLGNTEYVAKVVQQTIGGDLFRIETTQQYPLDHDPLVDQAAEEQDADARPELATHIENLDQYDTIILGYPNWWGDMPQPLYTFLEEYDLSGKSIIPFVTHGGSGFSNTIKTIAKLQPDATVSENTLSLSRNSVAESEADVVSWAESLVTNG